MRRVSKKTARLSLACKAERARYKQCLCQLCNSRQADDVHEIARGAYRHHAIHERCCWLALCRPCHELMDDYHRWPLARQLAIKLVADADQFDLVLFNQIRGRAVGAITLKDVVQYLRIDDGQD